MIQAFDEPSTEDEAQELKRFLEEGADVGLETIQRFATEPVSLRVPESVVISFPETADLLGQISGQEDIEVLLSLDFTDVSRVPEFAVGLFLNAPDADRSTPLEDPRFVTSVAFFCQSEERDGILVCVEHDGEPERFRIPLAQALERNDVRDELSISLVPLPNPEGELSEQTLQVAGSVEIVRSTVALEA
jgi:hypothetical protein